jgi:hypothetical protein
LVRPIAYLVSLGAAPTATCLLATTVGLVGLNQIGAPTSLLLVNGAALAIGAILVLILRRSPWRPGMIAALALVGLMAAPLLIGPEVDGVRRWLALGPLQLHAGMVVVPALAVIAATLSSRQALPVLALAGLIAARQPDLATALALCAAAAAIAVVQLHDPIRWLALLPTGAALLWCLMHRDTLAPVPFVEGLWSDAAARAPLLLAAMLGSLLLVIAAPLHRWSAMKREQRAVGAAFSAVVLGYMLASVIGAYPVPLFGGGAAPIIGLMLASALFARLTHPAAGKPLAFR